MPWDRPSQEENFLLPNLFLLCVLYSCELRKPPLSAVPFKQLD